MTADTEVGDDDTKACHEPREQEHVSLDPGVSTDVLRLAAAVRVIGVRSGKTVRARHLALAVTKLEEAWLWLLAAEKELL